MSVEVCVGDVVGRVVEKGGVNLHQMTSTGVVGTHAHGFEGEAEAR